MEEPRFLKSGEVDFKLRNHRELPPEAWQNGAGKWRQSSSAPPFPNWLILMIAIMFLCLWLGSCQRSDDMVTWKTSDGKTLRLTKQQALNMYVSGGNFSWDATRDKNPPEPQIPAPGAISGPK